MSKPPPASTRNPAFQSKLEPYREFIRECRAKRWSYPRIAAALQESHGLSAAPSTIFSFVKVAPSGAGSTRSHPRTIRQFSNLPQ
jgi:hypothetical protein